MIKTSYVEFTKEQKKERTRGRTMTVSVGILNSFAYSNLPWNLLSTCLVRPIPWACRLKQGLEVVRAKILASLAGLC